MSLIKHAERELRLAGFYDKDAMYGEMLPEAIMEIVKVFEDQGHSGMSASITRQTLNRLLDFKPLTPLTDAPDEWVEVGTSVWQNIRSGDCFSSDGGKTHYSIDDKERTVKPSKPAHH